MLYGEGETPLETDDKGQIVIDRSEAEVFRPETIASFEGKAVTITHPTEFVSPDNWSRLAKGILQNVRRGEGDNQNDLLADLLITDSVAINLVKNGLREVSCGYEADYTQKGEGRGVQTNIVGNHLALVDEGRAGSSYAINDHKRKDLTMKVAEKIKAIFGKAQDEAMKLVGDAEPDMKDKDKAKDADPDKKDDKKDDKAKDASAAYDEFLNMVKDLGEKILALSKPKDATSPATENQPAKTVAKDDEVAPSLEDRLKALEASVAKLLEGKAQSGDDADDGDDEGEESEDDDFDEGSMTGDTASRVEILSPGMKLTKDCKAKALTAAYGTQDGKKIIDSLTGERSAPKLDNPERVDMLFNAASELLKASRTSDFSKTKQTTRDTSSGDAQGTMTAERMNEINAKHYARN